MNERKESPASADVEVMRKAAADMRSRVIEAQRQSATAKDAAGHTAQCPETAKHPEATKRTGAAKRRIAKETRVCISKVKNAKNGVSSHIKDIADDLKYDVNAIMARDPAARSKIEAVLLYSGFHALAAHRLAHALNKKGAHFTARMISQATKFMTGIEIHPGATIGKGLFIDHGSGVVIGETAIVGDNCTIYQGVTLGGTGKETGKRHPTLKDNVMVGAGAKLLGNFTVGSGAKIAAGAVVLGDVAENSTAVGIPARIVRKNGERVTDEVDLDQTHIPDPVALQMNELQARIDELSRQLAEMQCRGEANTTEHSCDTDEQAAGHARDTDDQAALHALGTDEQAALHTHSTDEQADV